MTNGPEQIKSEKEESIVSCEILDPKFCHNRSYTENNIPPDVKVNLPEGDNLKCIGICSKVSNSKHSFACKYQNEGITVEPNKQL